MKIAAYYPWIYLKGGAERALLETVTRSRHEWTLYTNHFEPEATFPEFSDLARGAARRRAGAAGDRRCSRRPR